MAAGLKKDGRSYVWRSDPDEIARLVPANELRAGGGFLGITRRDIVIGPGEACLFIKDGKLEEVMTQSRLKNIKGGLINKVADFVKGTDRPQLLFIVTTPVELELPVKFTTKDRIELAGNITVRFRFTKEGVTKVINLLQREHVLTKAKLAERLYSEVIVTVFQPTVAKYSAEEFHGNIDIQREMEAAAIGRLKTTLALYGLELLKMFTVWDKSAYDEAMEYKAKLKMIYEKRTAYMDVHRDEELHKLENAHMVAKQKQESEWDLKFGDLIKGEKFKDIEWDAELGRQKRAVEAETEMKKTRFDEAIREKKADVDLDLEVKQKTVDIEMSKEEREAKLAMDMFAKVQEAKLARERPRIELERERVTMGISTADQQIKQLQDQIHDLEMKMLDAPADKMPLLQKMYEEKTKQLKYAQEEATKRQLGTVGGKETTTKFMEAEAERHNLEAYREAEAREREYTEQRMEREAEMMQAAKQNVPRTLVQGAPVQSSYVVHESAGHSSGLTCPNCGEPVQEGWKACPSCGYKLE